MGKTDTRFPTGSTMTEWSRGYGLGTEIPHIGLICSGRECLNFLKIDTDYSPKSTQTFPIVSEWHEVSSRVGQGIWFRRCTRVFLQRSDCSRSDGQVEWRRNPHHGSTQQFYPHVLGVIGLISRCRH
jgi:hypothetical protein